MGYQPGKGLGKNLQGISQPIEAVRRPGAAALGAYGTDVLSQKNKIIQRQFLGKDDEEIESKLNQQQKGETSDKNVKNWKRNQTKTEVKGKKIKVHVQSTEEMIAESLENSWNRKTDSTLKIIDMTGPRERVLTSLSEINDAKIMKPKQEYEATEFDIPELKSNLQRLVHSSERSLVRHEKTYLNAQRVIEDLTEEKIRVNSLLLEERIQYALIEKYENFVDDLQSKVNHQEISFFEFVQTLEKMDNDDFKKNSRMLFYDELILACSESILGYELPFWKAFETHSCPQNDYLKLFQNLKLICNKKKTFEIILWNHWFPSANRALQIWPSMKQYDQIITFVQKWREVLPKWLFDHFVVECLMPKIYRQVHLWNPLADGVPIHSWIHPWLPVLMIQEDGEDRHYLFEPIYETIRSKLASALTNWIPSDSSACRILQPWKGVFTEAAFQTFLELNIVSKLESALLRFEINPSHQRMDEWNWVLEWKSLISANTMVNLIGKCFFPKWLQVLYNWLASGRADLSEVGSWYQGWKVLLPDNVASHPLIKDLLKKALMMMDHCVNLNTGLKPFMSYYNPNAPLLSDNIPNPVPVPQPAFKESGTPLSSAIAAATSISFKKMVENRAHESGILFMPMADRLHQGKQVYQFGQYVVYIDNQVIFQQKTVNRERVWAPVLLTDLISLCEP